MDAPPEVTKRPTYTKLSPDEEQAFHREQTEYEAAYRRTGEPLALWEALSHVYRSGQTVPDWLRTAFFEFVTTATANEKTERYRERLRHVGRYICVRDLRETVNKRTGKKHTKDGALDEAVLKLQGMPEGGVSRSTIEDSYDTVRRSLERDGHESEFFLFVGNDDPNKGG
jgi:hypothetical protein